MAALKLCTTTLAKQKRTLKKCSLDRRGANLRRCTTAVCTPCPCLPESSLASTEFITMSRLDSNSCTVQTKGQMGTGTHAYTTPAVSHGRGGKWQSELYSAGK